MTPTFSLLASAWQIFPHFFLSSFLVILLYIFLCAYHVYRSLTFSSVQFSCCHVRLFATPRITARQASLSITNSRSSLKLVHRVDDAIQPSHPLSSPSPPAPNPSHHQSLFQRVNSSHEVAKVLEFEL